MLVGVIAFKNASGPPLFTIALTNDLQPRQVKLCMTLSSGEYGLIVSGETEPFTMGSGEMKTISSNDIIRNGGNLNFLEGYDELISSAASLGRLPSDTYTFDVVAKDVEQSEAVSQVLPIHIRVSNTKKVDIIGPGGPVTGRARDCERIFSNTPPIRWDSRMKVFRFVLAEYAPGEDPENALNKEPRFTRIFTVGNNANSNLTARDLGFNDRIERLPSNSFQYPASGTRLPLKPGKTYVYQVTGLVNSSSGFFSVPSEVYCFKIPKLDQLGAGRQQFELILRNFLESDYEKLFGEDGELAEYQPTGMTMNGKEVTLTEILTRMQKLKSRYSGYSVE